MFTMFDFPDLKLLEIGFESKSVPLSSAATFTVKAPPNRLNLLTSLVCTSTLAWRFVLDSFFIDRVNLRNEVVSNFLANDKGFLISRFTNPILVNPNDRTGVINFVPMRDEVKVDLFNLDAALAATMEMRAFAFVHMDPDKEYLAESSVQGAG